MSTPNIYQRINAVMKEVQYVQKDKQISGAGANYKAVTHDQVVSVIRESLVKNGVVVYPEQVSGGFIIQRDMNATPNPVKMGLYGGSYNVHFVNADNPEDKATVAIEAHANDNGDKAPGKCVTYAVKAATLKMFFLETGESDESRAEEANPLFINEEQQAKLFSLLCDEKGSYTPKGLKVCQAFKFQNLTDIKASKFDQILRAAS